MNREHYEMQAQHFSEDELVLGEDKLEEIRRLIIENKLLKAELQSTIGQRETLRKVCQDLQDRLNETGRLPNNWI